MDAVFLAEKQPDPPVHVHHRDSAAGADFFSPSFSGSSVSRLKTAQFFIQFLQFFRPSFRALHRNPDVEPFLTRTDPDHQMTFSDLPLDPVVMEFSTIGCSVSFGSLHCRKSISVNSSSGSRSYWILGPAWNRIGTVGYNNNSRYWQVRPPASRDFPGLRSCTGRRSPAPPSSPRCCPAPRSAPHSGSPPACCRGNGD